MTKHSRLWRDKKIRRIRIKNKVHNGVLGMITGVMGLLFLVSISSEMNIYTILIFIISLAWISLVGCVNKIE